MQSMTNKKKFTLSVFLIVLFAAIAINFGIVIFSNQNQEEASAAEKIYNVVVLVNNAEYGEVFTDEGVPINSFQVYENNQIHLGSWDGAEYANQFMISSGSVDGYSSIVATPKPATEDYVYDFVGWTGLTGGAITDDIVIMANFEKKANRFTINFEVDENSAGFGSVDVLSVVARRGEQVTFNKNVVTIGSNVITATPTEATNEFKYSFVAWEGKVEVVENNVTIKAIFERTYNNHLVSFVVDPAGYGSVSKEYILVEYGQTIEINDNILTIAGEEIVATPHEVTPEHTYSFVEWEGIPESSTISESTEITAKFSRVGNPYTLTLDPQGAELDEVETTRTVYYDGVYGELPELTLDGKDFKGWFTSAVGGTKVEADTLVDTASNHKIYAQWENREYDLTIYLEKDGAVHSTTRVKYEQSIELPNISRTGYNLLGWNNAETDTEFALTTMPAKDVNIYAVWEQIDYTITYVLKFDGNEDLEDEYQTYHYDDEITKLVPDELDGYIFKGWYNEQTYETKFNLTHMPAENITVYALWEVKKFVLTFNYNYEGAPENVEQNNDFNTKIEYPEDPTREGYTFIGWFDDAENGEEFTLEYMPADDVTVYAHWSINSYTLTYYFNYPATYIAKHPEAEQERIETYEYDADLSLIDISIDGFAFDGWFDDAENGEIVEITKMPAGDIDVYAYWTINTYIITATAGANGTITPTGDIEKQYEESQLFEFVPNTGYHVSKIVVDGNALVGSEFESAKANGYTFSNIEDDHSIRVEFEINTYTITVTAGANGTIDPNEDVVINYGESQKFTFTPDSGFHVSKIIVDGNELEGSAFESAKINGYTFSNITSTHTIKVEFAISSYTLTYNLNYEGKTHEEPYKYMQTISLIADPTRTGYTFGGWYNEAGCTTAINLTTMPAGDVEIFAKWEANEYTITYNFNYPEQYIQQNPNAELTREDAHKYTDIFKLYQPSIEGYTFGGWYYDLDFKQECLIDTMPAENVEVYAKWIANPFTLTFNLNYFGAENKTKVYEAGENIVSIPEGIERVGHTLEGWYIDVLCTTPFNFIMPTHDYTIYANWTVNAYTITYMLNYDGLKHDEQTLNYDAIITVPTGLTREGYTFKGWYTEAGCVNAFIETNMPAEDVIVYAKWDENEYKMTYNLNYPEFYLELHPDAKQTEEEYCKYTHDINLIEPEIEGFTFNGWYVNSTCENLFELTKMPANDINIYAGWTINSYTITASADSNGTISPTSAVKNYWESQTFTFTPKEGHHVSRIIVDDVDLVGEEFVNAIENGYTFENIANDHSIRVEFAINVYEISTSVTGNGEISPLGISEQEHGSTLVIYVTPAQGSSLDSIVVDGEVLTGIDFDFVIENGFILSNIVENHNIVFVFTLNTYKITATLEGKGNISSPGENFVKYGEELIIRISPNDGQYVVSVIVDDVELEKNALSDAINNGYAFSNVNTDHSIHVIFDSYKFNILLNVEGEGKFYTKDSLENIPYGESVEFTIEMDKFNYSVEVYVNDERVNAVGNVFKVENIQSNMKIKVIFVKKAFFETVLGIITIIGSNLAIIVVVAIAFAVNRAKRKRRTRIITNYEKTP